VAVITNGTLLSMPEVRQECSKADLVLPSLDAGDEKTFQEINKPYPNLDFVSFVEGLCLFCKEYSGPIWLEVFFCDGLNTDAESIRNLKELIQKIAPDRVQINTAVRPTAHPGVKMVSHEKMQNIASQLGPNTEVIADFPSSQSHGSGSASETLILDTLKRRPCGLQELCASLKISPNEAVKHLQHLLETGKIHKENRLGKTFYLTA